MTYRPATACAVTALSMPAPRPTKRPPSSRNARARARRVQTPRNEPTTRRWSSRSRVAASAGPSGTYRVPSQRRALGPGRVGPQVQDGVPVLVDGHGQRLADLGAAGRAFTPFGYTRPPQERPASSAVPSTQPESDRSTTALPPKTNGSPIGVNVPADHR